MKTKILYTLIILIFTGCASLKTKTKKQTDTNTIRDINETETVKTKRKGDTLSYTVLNPVLKDTVIYVRNTERSGGGTLRIAYDKQGRQDIDCMTAEFEEIKETIRNISENETKKENEETKEKESILNGTFIIYVFLGLAGLLIVNKLMNKYV